MKKLIPIIMSLGMTGTALAEDVNLIVENANQQWNEALNTGKLDALVSMYAEQATVSPGNGEILTGHAAIQNLFGSFISNGVNNHQIETVNVIASEGQITQVGYWKAQGLDADQQPISFGGVLVTVLQENAEGEWHLQSHVWNMAP